MALPHTSLSPSGLFIPTSPDLGISPPRRVVTTTIACGLGPSRASYHLVSQRLRDQRRGQRRRAVKELAPSQPEARGHGPKLFPLRHFGLRQGGRAGLEQQMTTKRRAVPGWVMLGVRSCPLSSSLCGLPGGSRVGSSEPLGQAPTCR